MRGLPADFARLNRLGWFLSLPPKRSNPGIVVLARRGSRHVECGHFADTPQARWRIWDQRLPLRMTLTGVLSRIFRQLKGMDGEPLHRPAKQDPFCDS